MSRYKHYRFLPALAVVSWLLPFVARANGMGEAYFLIFVLPIISITLLILLIVIGIMVFYYYSTHNERHEKESKNATRSFLLAIVSILCIFILLFLDELLGPSVVLPLVFIVLPVIPATGIILGARGIRSQRKKLAIAGIILNILFLLIAILLFTTTIVSYVLNPLTT